ncbi:MAG: chemotaxis protein CheA, partial [Gammaproteobacteria bacterium]
LKKEVVLEMIGEETDLDKNLVEALADPLVHLVRNSVDHGVEMPDVREAAGKPRQGTVVLSAEQEGDHILLTIQDDGAGIDADVLRQKVVEKGLMDEDAVSRLSDKEVYNLIFLPGFSTKQEISDISGRGVGMDVVKTRINQLNGMIDIDSTRGKGTIMSIKVPLTLAIMPTLMVKLGKEQQTFALPLVNVNEIIELDTNRINKVDGQSVIIVRGKPIPLFYLNGLLHNSGIKYEGGSAHVVIVSVGTSHVGLLVDKLLGREEVVIKPLGAMLQGTRGLAGATITGNGKIALIVDLPDLIQARASNF